MWSAFLSSFALIAVAIAPRDAPVPFLIAGGFIGTATAVIYNVNQVSLRQAITPDRMLGRMNATMRFIVWGTIPIGALVGGVLGERHRPAGHDLGRRHRILPRLPSRTLVASEIAPGDPAVGTGMTLEAPMRCSALAEELGEPMIGSVDQRVRWLLVEDRSAWGNDAVGDVLGAELARAAKERRVRVLLIRRREGDPASDAVRRAILVDTATREMAIRSVDDLDEHLARRRGRCSRRRASAHCMTDPIFLVCTNGKRDACCALRGRALMTALATDHAERIWECTHLGGHRFAGNLVCLPDGIIYGRVSADDGPRLADAYLAGRLDPALLRGRSAWPAPAQVAEQELRLRTGLGRHRRGPAHRRGRRATRGRGRPSPPRRLAASVRAARRAGRSAPPDQLPCRRARGAGALAGRLGCRA